MLHHSRCSLILYLCPSVCVCVCVCLSLSLALSVRPDKKEDAKDALKRVMLRHGIDFNFLNFGTSSIRIFSLFSPIYYSLTLSSHSHIVQLFPFCPFSLCQTIPTLRRDEHLNRYIYMYKRYPLRNSRIVRYNSGIGGQSENSHFAHENSGIVPIHTLRRTYISNIADSSRLWMLSLKLWILRRLYKLKSLNETLPKHYVKPFRNIYQML